MFEAFMNLLLVVAAAAVTGIWIAAVAESDGKCGGEDCDRCLYPCGSYGEEREDEYEE